MKTVQKRILVTGGAGFLGSHLCERLSARGHDILCADNYFTGRKDNIAHLLQEPNFEAMRHDNTFPLYVEVEDRKSTRLNSSHEWISYAVFCLKKKKKKKTKKNKIRKEQRN